MRTLPKPNTHTCAGHPAMIMAALDARDTGIQARQGDRRQPAAPVTPRPAAPPGTARGIGIDDLICFTPGTRILTQWGERPVETLQPGSLVVTRDHGLQPLRWTGRRAVRGTGDLAPVVIGTASSSHRAPLMVSPLHRVLFTGYHAAMLFGESEVLVAARHLVNNRDIYTSPQDEVTYIHLMFDRHELIYASGIATESFHGGDAALTGLATAARETLFGVFPELRSASRRHRAPARRCLLAQEAALLRQEHDEIQQDECNAPGRCSGAAQ